MMKNKVICIVGMPGAGKSLVSDELVEKGYAFFRFGQITLDIIKEKNLEVSESNERKIRENLRKKHGMGAFALLNISKIDELREKSNVVGDGLYSWSEYKILKERYNKDLFIIAVYASPEKRYLRLSERSAQNDHDLRFRSFTKEEAKARDYAEIENLEKGGPIAMADFTIINTRTINELKNQVNQIINNINND